MRNLFHALFETVIFLSLAAIVFARLAVLDADVNISQDMKDLLALSGIIFVLGGVWSIAGTFGLVPMPSELVRRGRRA